ncbi:discoidin domain-containing protein, partial [uncultured Demequina sp.]|uniref:discoidin domain-containing protein n=1 Tax=uncultured Demequina sp. TaxID=693499 RepID=UPI0025E1CBDE
MDTVVRPLSLMIAALLAFVAVVVPSPAGRAADTATALDRSGWALSSSGAWIPLGNAIDGDPSTSWLGDGDQYEGMWFQIDAGEQVTFDAIELAQSGEWDNAYPRAFVVEVSDDAAAWTAVATETGTYADQLVILEETTSARYVRLTLTASVGAGEGGWAIGEANLIRARSADRSGWSLSTSGWWLDPALAIDGDESTSWVSDGDQRDDMWFQVDAGEAVSFDTVEMTRPEWDNAYARAYVIEGSIDGAAWSTLAAGAGSLADERVELDSPATARYVRVSLTSS